MGEEHIEPRDTPLTPGRPPAARPDLAPPPDRIAPGPPAPLAGKLPVTTREPAKKDAPPEVKDSVRELVETIVFVVVLVLLLKTFLAEAFVIPTGSMADTLLGYHREFKCEQCGFRFLVNASDEAEKGHEPRGGYCPNCGFENPVRRPEAQPRGD